MSRFVARPSATDPATDVSEYKAIVTRGQSKDLYAADASILHLNIVAIHHHMTAVKPTVIFLHYYGTGPAAKLAEGVRAAVDVLGRAPATRR